MNQPEAVSTKARDVYIVYEVLTSTFLGIILAVVLIPIVGARNIFYLEVIFQISVFAALALVALLLLIAASAWKGLDDIVEGANRWTWLALGLAATTLLVAALRLTPGPAGRWSRRRSCRSGSSRSRNTRRNCWTRWAGWIAGRNA